MSSRKSSSGSRGASRTRSARSGAKSAGRRSAHSGSLSAKRHSASNTMRGKRGRRAGSSASSASSAVKLLKQDHREVAEALEEFESAERDEKQMIARRICKMLTVHAQIEEELLYPAARDALDSNDAHLVAEARVEHASLKELISQIEHREQMDEQYEAKVCVLGEYVEHHVGEEEKEIFPRLERSSLDLDALGERLAERKRELMGESRSDERPDTTSGLGASPSGMSGGMRGGRGQRATGLHARRR